MTLPPDSTAITAQIPEQRSGWASTSEQAASSTVEVPGTVVVIHVLVEVEPREEYPANQGVPGAANELTTALTSLSRGE